MNNIVVCDCGSPQHNRETVVHCGEQRWWKYNSRLSDCLRKFMRERQDGLSSTTFSTVEATQSSEKKAALKLVAAATGSMSAVPAEVAPPLGRDDVPTKAVAAPAAAGSEFVPVKSFGEPVIELYGVSKSYKLAGGEEVPALRDLSLHSSTEFPPIRRGEFVLIRGPSGGGKTTLLNIIGTIDVPSKGKLKLFDEVVDFEKTSDAALADLRLRKIGFVFQSFNLLSNLTAFENVELPMAMLGKLSEKERRERAQKLLRMVDLEDRMGHLPSECSGGEQQRIAIARALANEPDVLLGDECTGDLDTANCVRTMDLLLKINQERRMTIVMVTHNADLECYADRIITVGDGHFLAQAINTVQTRLDLESYQKYLHNEAED
jgi:putative ABC transport system ATP-binding protein